MNHTLLKQLRKRVSSDRPELQNKHNYAFEIHSVNYACPHVQRTPSRSSGSFSAAALAGGVQTQVECDFESDLCGWTHGEAAEFQWTRNSGHTPSTDMFTGPSHDHTLGDRQQGSS